MTRAIAAALVGLCIAQGAGAQSMHQHPTTGHGFYSGYCCSGYTQRNGIATGDCAVIEPEHVQVTPDGYLVTLEPGDHPTVRRRLQRLFRYPDADPSNDRTPGSPEAMPPGDENFHACVLPNSQELRCLYSALSGV